ncbi:MAG: hypothetical protein ABIL62_11975 [Planctomycetota bacterium]
MLDLDKLEQIKRIAIIALFSDDDLMDSLVLKGGNALDMIYGVAQRASPGLCICRGYCQAEHKVEYL